MSDFFEFAQQNWFLFAALMVIIGMLAGNEILHRLRGIKTLSAAEALRLMNDQDAWMVDIRDTGEYKDSHIPQARHMPFATLAERQAELGKAGDRPIIFYCRSGATSQAACTLMKKQGINQVYSLQGGLPAWLEANLPVSRKK